MPIATPNNNFLMSIAKQSDENTTSSTATYSVPVYSANVTPIYDERRVEVTDASSIQADVYKGQTYWTAEAEFPAFALSLGTFLQSLWPTDTKTGAGDPYTHTFSGLGGTQPWIALYTEFPGLSFEETFGDGTATGIGFTATSDGGPLRVRYTAMGKTPDVASYTSSTADDLTDGYFTLQMSGAKIELDLDTPNSNPSSQVTYVQSISLNVDRAATPILTADGTSISYIGAGKVNPTGTATFVYDSMEAYRATFYGAVAGTAASSTIVNGALELTFDHTTNSNAVFTIYCPAVQFKAAKPVPSPSGDALTVDVTLNIQKPSSGDHVQPVLLNANSSAY